MHSVLEDLSFMAQVGQFFGQLAGFYFLWDQLREVKANLHTQTHSNIYTQYVNTIRSFLDKPQLYPYFRDEVRLPEKADPVLEAEVKTLCELMTTLFEHATLERGNMPNTWEHCWLPYIMHTYDKSYEMRRFFNRSRKFYVPEFCQLVSKYAEPEQALEQKTSPA